MDGQTGRLREVPVGTTYQNTGSAGMQTTTGTGVNPPMQSQGMQSTQGMQPQMQGVGGGEQGRNTEVGGGAGDFGIDTGNKGRDAGQTNFAAGPGPVPGTAGGFRDPAEAAAIGGPVVGPGFGPGAVKATPGAKGDYDPLDNSKRTPMG